MKNIISTIARTNLSEHEKLGKMKVELEYQMKGGVVSVAILSLMLISRGIS